jgi:DNA repair exonuclease SbcCD nuclease subunit
MLNLEEGKFPIIIKPNLGQPILINLRDYRDENNLAIKNITFNAIVITLPNYPAQKILESFYSNLYIQAVLKDEGDFTKRRGEKFTLQAIQIKKLEKFDFNEKRILEEENCMLWDIYNSLLEVENVFGKRKELHKITFQISDVNQIEHLIASTGRDFILFDIVHDVPNMMKFKINYHSIAIYNKDWDNFNFIHATDFHIARRNDFIINFIKKKVKIKIKNRAKHPKRSQRINDFILERDFEFKKGFQEEKLDQIQFSKLNFNYSLRKLVEFINEQVTKNNIDFILMTGDLIDYLNIARGNYQYENNFQAFIDILLGKNRNLDKPPYLGEDEEFINKKEIMAPVFTLAGNHDYRSDHYGMRFGQIHKIFGMTRSDIKGYYDIKFFNYFTALRSRLKFLKDYFRYINPNLNYKVRVGNSHSFIFLDTGEDSIADLHDLLKGGPSTKGIKDFQVDLLRAYIKLSYNKKILVVMHTPPVSPNLSYLKRRKFAKLFNVKKKELKWSFFYEENLKKYNETGRLDQILNMKYQTIMYNWNTLLKIFTGSDEEIRRKIDIVVCGHTHTLKEYRLKEAKETEIINFGFWLFPIYIRIPCEMYTSNYSEKFNNFENFDEFKIWFDVNKPFVFQTQATGPISAKSKFKPPGFRFFKVKNNQIVNADIYSIHLT